MPPKCKVNVVISIELLGGALVWQHLFTSLQEVLAGQSRPGNGWGRKVRHEGRADVESEPETFA